jgi:hypothetical protein
MGVQDYRCSVCGDPASYECGEKAGKECEETGMGNDEAVLDLFFFAAEDAPEDPSGFEEARGRARRVETRPFGYDWGDWEFVPSLNYRELLMDDGDDTGVWLIRPFEEDVSDGSPIALEIPPGERVWVVNYCPPCREHFVDGKAGEEPCVLHLEAIADSLGLDFDRAAKAPFIEQVRARVAKRRPVAK